MLTVFCAFDCTDENKQQRMKRDSRILGFLIIGRLLKLDFTVKETKINSTLSITATLILFSTTLIENLPFPTPFHGGKKLSLYRL
jgi:hypothetical protein